MRKKFVFGLVAALALSACGKNYDEIERGAFDGRLIVEWYKPDLFIYRPFPNDPLKFERANGQVYTPATFTTDAGSIPRPLRAFKHYSPWGYAKAYIIHDWVFAEHRCGRLPEVSFEDSADILSEGIKTMIEEREEADPSERKVLQAIDAAVRSEIAKGIWNSGPCEDVPDGREGTLATGEPDARFIVE